MRILSARKITRKMSGRRIFIAVDISDAARSVCSRHIDHLRREFAQVRVGWERPEKLHITLRFLGDVEAGTMGELQEHLTETTSRHSEFKARLSDTGVFPSRSRPRILWTGVADRSNAIISIFDEVDAVCNTLGFTGELKEFRPHVTLGRLRQPGSSKDLVSEHLKAKVKPVEFEVTGVVIYESKLQPTGSVYSVVSRANFRPD